uniref:Gag protein n=1 Tax=Nippostrongylus brasiliensis TaxID=27835 RepID=A0A0N4XJ69_NIPBR
LRRVVEEKDQRLVFLQEVGGSNYELLESLLQGRELEEVTLDELRSAMEKHYQPKRLVLAERFGLMSKSQKPGQALHEFYAELQKAANSCQFEKIKDHRDAVVTMVFIGGLASVETRKRLLEKEELTSKEALEQAEAIERVGANAPHLKEGPQEVGVAQVKLRSHVRQRAGNTPSRNVGSKPGKGPAREKMRCWGKVPALVKFAGKLAKMDIHLFKEATHSLCGRDMIRELQINCGPHYGMVHSVKELTKVEIKKEIVRILEENKELFQSGLGKCVTTKAHPLRNGSKKDACGPDESARYNLGTGGRLPFGTHGGRSKERGLAVEKVTPQKEGDRAVERVARAEEEEDQQYKDKTQNNKDKETKTKLALYKGQ